MMSHPISRGSQGSEPMNTLIIYYSLTGNTEYTANNLAQYCQADLLRLETNNPYPKSRFKKYFWCGKSAVMSEEPELKPFVFDPYAYECIVFGFPVWAGNLTPPIRSFVKKYRDSLSGKRLAAFACQSGAGAHKALAKLEELLPDSLYARLILNDPLEKQNSATQTLMEEFADKLMV